MDPERSTQVTDLLNQIRAGDACAGGRLLDFVYQEMRGLAGALYSPYRHRNTLQPTALVHEAWMKMAGHLDSFESRRHFFAVASKAMRQVLADRVRDAQRQKRGGEHETLVLDEAIAVDPRAGKSQELNLIDLDAKLSQLAEMNERHGRVVEMRMFGAMTMQEIADELETSKRTIENDWAFARAWLRRELMGPEHEG